MIEWGVAFNVVELYLFWRSACKSQLRALGDGILSPYYRVICVTRLYYEVSTEDSACWSRLLTFGSLNHLRISNGGSAPS